MVRKSDLVEVIYEHIDKKFGSRLTRIVIFNNIRFKISCYNDNSYDEIKIEILNESGLHLIASRSDLDAPHVESVGSAEQKLLIMENQYKAAVKFITSAFK